MHGMERDYGWYALLGGTQHGVHQLVAFGNADLDAE
jgi:hypothetical protein